MSKKSFRFFIAILSLGLITGACQARQTEDGSFNVPQSPLLAALESKVGLIAYVGTDGNIYTMNQAGSDVIGITIDAAPGEEVFRVYSLVRWSPDSQKLAFVGFTGEGRAAISNATLTNTRVFTAERNGTNQKELFTSPNALPVNLGWAPDGASLALMTTNTYGDYLVLRQIPIDGGEAQVLDTGPTLYWDWGPAGDRLLIHAGTAASVRPDSRLAFLHLGERIVEEGLQQPPAFFQTPAFSPTGSQMLVFIETDSGEGQLVIADMNGETEQVLETFTGSAGFDWSPDGRYVAYAMSEIPNFISFGPLTVFDTQEPTAARIVSPEDSVLAFFWSPDASRLLYFLPAFGEDEEGNQSLVGLNANILERESGESRELFSFTPTQEFFNLLTNYDQYQRVMTVWSPDSANVVLPVQINGGSILIVAQVEADFAPRGLEPGILATWSWGE